jgi:multidrug efflux pump subunit AcrA (membrane-fusion protein)
MSLMKNIIISSTVALLAQPLAIYAEITAPATTLATQEQLIEYQILDGQIEVVNKSTVSAQTGGIISSLSYDIGDTVKQGELIARITSQNQESSVLEAKATVNQSKASISAAQASISGALATMKEAEAAIVRATATIAQTNASTKEAQANYAAARSEFDRVKGLFAKQILTKSQYDRTEATMRSTLARVESAKAQQNSAKADRVAAVSRLSSAKAAISSSKANLSSAKASLSSSKANLSKAGEQLGYTEIIAPYSGIVTERHVELGEVVSPGTPIMTGISLDQMRAVANIPQRLILKVRKYNSARLFVDGDEVGTAIKKLTIFPYADPATNAFKVRATLDSASKGLFPGVFVKIGFEVGTEKHLVIPISSVAHRSEVTGVYVMDENEVPSLRQVRLGLVAPDSKVRVLAGLDEGEKVALDPVQAAVYLKHLRQLESTKEENAHE